MNLYYRLKKPPPLRFSYQSKNRGGIFRLKRLWLFALAPIGFLATVAAMLFPDLAEWYATTVYKGISIAGSRFFGIFPFSVGEFMLYILLALAILYPFFAVVSLIKNPQSRGKRAIKLVASPLCLVCVLYFFFVTNCGINYHRLTFADTSGLVVIDSSKEELIALCEGLAAQTSALKGELEAKGQRLPQSDFAKQGKAAQAAFAALKTDYPLLNDGYAPPKPVIASQLMSYLNITGIFLPFTFEANVNTHSPAFERPATLCHELAHLRGYMREDEANFIGVLACEKSEDIAFRYSGVSLSYLHSINALYSADHEQASRIASTLSPEVSADYEKSATYWARYETPISEISTSVNNSFLQANSQKDGVKSYGRMVDLLLAKQRAQR